jgi:hypothetical protein
MTISKGIRGNARPISPARAKLLTVSINARGQLRSHLSQVHGRWIS